MAHRAAALLSVIALTLLAPTPLVAPPVAAGQAPPLPTVEHEVICPDNVVVVTIDNPTAAGYRVDLEVRLETPPGVPPDDLPPVDSAQVVVPPGETVQVTVDLAAGHRNTVTITGDGDFPPTTFTPVLGCHEPDYFVYVTARTICPSYIVVTIGNPFDVARDVSVRQLVQGEEPVEVNVAPGDIVDVVIDSISLLVEIGVIGAGEFGRETLGPFAQCPVGFDFPVTTTEGTPVEFELPCAPIEGETPHGRVEALDRRGMTRYTPDPGFVGVDESTWDCHGPREILRLIVTVTPAQAPAEPVPEEPTFTG